MNILPALLFGATCLLGASAFGQVNIPSDVFDISDLEKAKAKAAKEGKPLSFVLIEPGST